MAIPYLALAQTSGLVKCGIKDPDTCTYQEFMDLIQNALNFMIYVIAKPIATMLLAYAGFNMITSGGSEAEYTKARKMLTNILIAYAVMLSAFLVIKLVFSLIFPEDYSLLS